MQIELRPYDHPHVQALVERLQAEYLTIYGQTDAAPASASELAPPRGSFALGYVDDVPVAMGGWRLRDDGRAELKRMYVVDEARGRGLSRDILRWLEASAIAAGMTEMILESNQKHPAALGLYRSHGYTPVPAFGYYSASPENVCLGRSLAPPTGRGQPGAASAQDAQPSCLGDRGGPGRDVELGEDVDEVRLHGRF
ncbi:GNAT family N-acetyltransferase [Sanguibacter antarcticus]|uniref:Acetyltransferase (GNAT) family protein n=1 Tax=Sanguibacter antarcticus TaxID=372484 RepID=A0A2A9E710_9MICO|nr:GNAT family N-acetyltransferase [Sanguibacter antarcticus]PFG34633.1 acetyltransferase (GNAT) family protein [Sanguibacter antarcticus]